MASKAGPGIIAGVASHQEVRARKFLGRRGRLRRMVVGAERASCPPYGREARDLGTGGETTTNSEGEGAGLFGFVNRTN